MCYEGFLPGGLKRMQPCIQPQSFVVYWLKSYQLQSDIDCISKDRSAFQGYFISVSNVCTSFLG